MEDTILINRVVQISEEWGDEVKYLSEEERTKIDDSISAEMDEFVSDFQVIETVSYMEASKIHVNT